MRLVATRHVEPGKLLARDVLTGRADGLPLLRAGTRVSAEYREGLMKAGIHAIYVDDELGEGINARQVISDHTRSEATVAVARAFDATRFALTTRRAISHASVVDLNRVASLIATDVLESSDEVVILADLATADAYTLQHSIDVAALGIKLGERLLRRRAVVGLSPRESAVSTEHRLARLGLGLLLHDIGKLAVPTEILNKPGPLTDVEMAVIRTHPMMGVQLMSGRSVGPLAKIVVRSHHERFDGSGYPEGRHGQEIHEFARIAAVADVYDAITSQRSYSGAAPPQDAIDVIEEGAGHFFDPEIVTVFREVVAPHPPGTEVTLSDGRRGVVVSIPAGQLDRPVVRVGFDPSGRKLAPEEIALADTPDLRCV